MQAHRSFLALLACTTTADAAVSWELLKSDAECGSANIDLAVTIDGGEGTPTLGECAAACDAHTSPERCTFFNYGKGGAEGRCYMEVTSTMHHALQGLFTGSSLALLPPLALAPTHSAGRVPSVPGAECTH